MKISPFTCISLQRSLATSNMAATLTYGSALDAASTYICLWLSPLEEKQTYCCPENGEKGFALWRAFKFYLLGRLLVVLIITCL